MTLRRALGCWTSVLVLLFGTAPTYAGSAQTYLDSLVDFQRYGDSIWHTASGAYSNAPPDSGYWGDGKSSGNGGIRGNCGVAVAYAVLCQAYPSDTNRPARIAKIRQALNYAAKTHVSSTNVCNDKLQWGHAWQTSLWAGSMGLACMLVQADLGGATVAAVQRAIADEATYRASVAPASGFVSDTKAEENGWNGNVVALAASWLSTNPNAALWLNSAKDYLANTYTVANTNGDPLASWLTTVTLYPTFALENHGFYHPTYQMVAGMSMGDSLLMAHLANPTLESQLRPFAEHNILNVWSNLNHVVLDSGDFGSPAGMDWELHDFEQNSYVAWVASHFNDPLARWEDEQLAKLVRYRQTVNGDGTYVGPSGGGFYREAVEARRTAIAYLHWMHADFPTGPSTPPPTSFEHLPDVDIIVHRSPYAMTSICYGPQTNGTPPRIMAVIEPTAACVPTNAFLATPRLPGVIGMGALGNPTGARLVSLTTNSSGFFAELQVINGVSGTTEVYVNCTGETVGILEIPWPAINTASPAGSFATGIENDPLCGGTRLLEWSGGSATITNRSGVSRNVTNAWVCVDGRYGLTAGPAGYFSYQASSSYNRSGAAQDTLQFVAQTPLGPRFAVYFPGKSAAQTASNAAAVSWSVTSSNAILTFPGWAGAPTQIAAALAAPAPPYGPYVLPVASITASSSQSGFPAANAVDGILTNYWVSLYGPSNHAEWLQASFPRTVALSGFQVYPRTDNGGYGPRDVQLFVNVTNSIPGLGVPTSGSNVWTATMAPTTTLDVQFPLPIYATNAVLVILSAYDRGLATATARNVQVNELLFYERALPGTFADWALRQTNSAILLPDADPDLDHVPNLLEFAMGGNPLAADPQTASLQPAAQGGGTFAFRYHERKNLGDVQRYFESSADLVNWIAVTPNLLTNVVDLGDVWIQEARFNLTNRSFFRLRFSQ